MAFERRHSATADATFSATGSTNWNANQTPTGADVGGIPYCPTATTEATSANLTYTETSGPRLQVGSGGTTNAGLILGYTSGSSLGNAGALWGTGVTEDGTNAALYATLNNTIVNSKTTLYLAVNGGAKAYFVNTAGQGMVLNAGTATTDVQALSATQTWNASGVTFTGIKYTITDTASAAGSLAAQILGGASGTTHLWSLTKNGNARFADGTQTAPSVAAASTTGTGLGWLSSDRMFFSKAGTYVILFDAAGIHLDGGKSYASSASGFGSAADVGMSRTAAAEYAIGNGTAGNASGTMRAKFKSSDGTAGVASFGPSAVTSITVKDGIITAIS